MLREFQRTEKFGGSFAEVEEKEGKKETQTTKTTNTHLTHWWDMSEFRRDFLWFTELQEVPVVALSFSNVALLVWNAQNRNDISSVGNASG